MSVCPSGSKWNILSNDRFKPTIIIDRKLLFQIVIFPRTLDAPIYGVDDVQDNQVITICYRDPKYPENHIFQAKRLPGAIDPPNVLAPDNRPSNYRPQIGFNRDFPQASLGNAGHRMVNHYSGGNNMHQSSDNRGGYVSIAPPQNYRSKYTNRFHY